MGDSPSVAGALWAAEREVFGNAAFSLDGYINTLVDECKSKSQAAERVAAAAGGGAARGPESGGRGGHTHSGALSGTLWNFEPEALEQAFAAKIQHVLQFRAHVDGLLAGEVASGAAAEEAHVGTLDKLEEQVESELIERVAALEDKATSFANTASRIGDRLETLHRAKLSAHDCAEYMTHLSELQDANQADFAQRTACDQQCAGRHTRWSSIFRAEPFNDDVHKVALRVKELHRFATEMASVMGDDNNAMRENAQRYREELQQHLQHEFFACGKRGETRRMKACATTLEHMTSFNSNCAEMLARQYVDERLRNAEEPVIQQDLTSAHHRNAKQELVHALSSGGRGGAGGPDQAAQLLLKKFSEMYQCLKKEYKVIVKVFPQPKRVMDKLVHKVIINIVHEYCHTLLADKALQRDAARYCRMLAACVAHARALAKKLNQWSSDDFDASSVVNKEVLAQYIFGHEDDDGMGPQGGMSPSTGEGTTCGAYWDLELQAHQGALLRELRPLLTEGPAQTQQARQQRLAAEKAGGRAAPSPEQQNNQAFGGVLGCVTAVLTSSHQAIERSASLLWEGSYAEPAAAMQAGGHGRLTLGGEGSSSHATAAQEEQCDRVHVIVCLLVDGGRANLCDYVKALVNVAQQRCLVLAQAASSSSSSSASAQQQAQQQLSAIVEWHPLRIVRLAAEVVGKLQHYYKHVVLHALQAASHVQTQCWSRVLAFMHAAARQVQATLDAYIAAVMEEAQRILKQFQQQPDFTPRDRGGDERERELVQAGGRGLELTLTVTTACKQCVEHIKREYYVMGQHLRGENLLSLVGELGKQLHALLRRHIHSFRFSRRGGMQLQTDLDHYLACVREFEPAHPRVSAQFAGLRDCACLFTAAAPDLPAVLRGGGHEGRGEEEDAREAEGMQGGEERGGGHANGQEGPHQGLVQLGRKEKLELLHRREDYKKIRSSMVGLV